MNNIWSFLKISRVYISRRQKALPAIRQGHHHPPGPARPIRQPKEGARRQGRQRNSCMVKEMRRSYGGGPVVLTIHDARQLARQNHHHQGRTEKTGRAPMTSANRSPPQGQAREGQQHHPGPSPPRKPQGAGPFMPGGRAFHPQGP